MDIKNADFKAAGNSRQRAMNYWQNNVIQNFLPPIDHKKKYEVEARIASNN